MSRVLDNKDVLEFNPFQLPVNRYEFTLIQFRKRVVGRLGNFVRRSSPPSIISWPQYNRLNIIRFILQLCYLMRVIRIQKRYVASASTEYNLIRDNEFLYIIITICFYSGLCFRKISQTKQT